jgi:dTDP-4-dehydrorhamnose reductase
MRVAVTGSTGRLGSALVRALADAPFTGASGPLAWTRAELDLDAPEGVDGALDRDRPEVVVHTAAWTDVDGCARDPDLAMRRNGVATGHLAIGCAQRGIDLLVVSTNEVFDGARTDRRPYAPGDDVAPANPYGASKAAAEDVARAAYVNRRGTVGIVRTAWLYGPPGPDFPRKIADAARQAASDGETLRVVGDEWGTPTYAADLADAIVDLLAENSIGGIHHLVAAGVASRADWARDVIARLEIEVPVDDIPGSTWQRASTPPAWGVLAPTPLPSGEPIRPWQQAMAEYEPLLKRALTAAAG